MFTFLLTWSELIAGTLGQPTAAIFRLRGKNRNALQNIDKSEFITFFRMEIGPIDLIL